MEQKEIDRILRKYKDMFKALEDYDKKPLEKQFEEGLKDLKSGRVRRVA